MSRILAGLFVVVALVVIPSAPAVAADALVVQIKAGQVTLNADGTVSVPLRAKCSSSLDAFEVDLSVTQGTVSGQNNTVGGSFPACTGKWQSTTLIVAADYGAFTTGPATISVFLGAFDQMQGDLEARDSAIVRL